MTENEKLRRAIEEEKELYEIAKDRYEKLGVKNCKDRAEEHNMMVKWLEEVMQYRAIGTIEEFMSLKECFGHTVPKSRGKAIYDKAIDDFTKALLNSPFGDWNNIPCTEIKRIAEQMKGGAE